MKGRNRNIYRNLLLSGYHALKMSGITGQKHVTIVKNAQAKQFYLELKRLLHFQEKKLHQYKKHDKSHKIRPFLQGLFKNSQKYLISHKKSSVDEMNIRYYVQNALRQFIKTKPIKFEYNPWILYGKHVYCYNFTLYFGK